jgi:hypothetical protein
VPERRIAEGAGVTPLAPVMRICHIRARSSSQVTAPPRSDASETCDGSRGCPASTGWHPGSRHSEQTSGCTPPCELRTWEKRARRRARLRNGLAIRLDGGELAAHELVEPIDGGVVRLARRGAVLLCPHATRGADATRSETRRGRCLGQASKPAVLGRQPFHAAGTAERARERSRTVLGLALNHFRDDRGQ